MIKKIQIFSDRKYCDPNPIGFRTKRAKTDYKSKKSNYKFKSKILKEKTQIDQIKYIYIYKP